MPIPVEDLVQARGAVHQLKLMVERGGFDEVDLEMLGHVLVGPSAEQPPRTRGEILRYKAAVEMELMRAVKRAIDPHGIMNPGKVL